MSSRFLFEIIFAIGLLAGCDKSNDESQQRAIDVASKSIKFAREDSVDFSSYSVMSVIRMRDGRQSVVKVNDEMTGFDKNLYAKLQKKILGGLLQGVIRFCGGGQSIVIILMTMKT